MIIVGGTKKIKLDIKNIYMFLNLTISDCSLKFFLKFSRSMRRGNLSWRTGICMMATLFLYSVFISLVAGRVIEPKCSKFDYDEQLLEKMVRQEHKYGIMKEEFQTLIGKFYTFLSVILLQL